MATAQRSEPGTDLAIAQGAVGVLPSEIQTAIQLRRMQNQVAGQLAGMNWGKSLDLDTRRSVADWGQRYRVDPATEIEVLGSNVYIKASFYLRKLSELIARGLVEYAVADHIEDDKRLSKLGPEGEGEQSRRLRERIKFGVPDNAASAVVFRVKLRSMTHEVTGCKWAGNGSRKNDPVGEQFPVEATESRAARRCLRQLASHVEDLRDVVMLEEAAEELGTHVVAPAKQAFRESQAHIRQLSAGRSHVHTSQLPSTEPGNPYADPDYSKAPLQGEKYEPSEPEQTDSAEPQGDLLPEPDPREFVIGFGDHAGKTLGSIDIADVRNLYRFTEKKGIQPAFRAAALKLLEAAG